MNNETFELRHIKLKPAVFYTAIGISFLLYISYVRFLPSKGHFIFAAIGGAFNLYLFILTRWRDIVIISNKDNTVRTEFGVWPFTKSSKAYISNSAFISVAHLRLGKYGGTFRISLMTDRMIDSFRLIDSYKLEEAWKFAVSIAKYLNLPICDRTEVPETIWPKENIPETIKAKQERLWERKPLSS